MVFVTFEYNVKAKKTIICCTNKTAESALDAIDDYAMARLRILDDNVAEDARPMDLDELYKHNNGIFAVLDENHKGPQGESERVNIVQYNQPNAVVTHYFTFQHCEEFVDEALAKGSKLLDDVEVNDEAGNFTVPKLAQEEIEDQDDTDSSDGDFEWE